MVVVNGREVGRSPATWKFTHYGKVRVTAYLEGHLSEQRIVKLKTPWYQYPGADFFSDLLTPTTIHDEHEVTILLQPLPGHTKAGDEALASEVGERAVALRAEMRELEQADALEKAKKSPSRREDEVPVDFD